MKPLGTITIFLPYVDDKTGNILNSTMMDARDFSDFVDRLSTKVATKNTPMLTQYLGCCFALWLENPEFAQRIVETDRIPTMAKPLQMLFAFLDDKPIEWEEMTELLSMALSDAPNDWFVCHLYLFWSLLAAYLPVYPPSDFKLHPFDSVIQDINHNDEYEYFRSFLLLIESFKLASEQEYSRAVNLAEQALQIAHEFDDQVLANQILLFLGQHAKHSHMEKAVDYLVQAKELSEKLGYVEGLGLVQHILSHIMGIRGEYDAAIHHQLEYRDIILSKQSPLGYVDAIIALYYNYTGDGESALKWIGQTKITKKTPPRFAIHFQYQKVYSLYNLSRYDEARNELAKFQELAIKSGEDGALLRSELLEALLDKSEGDFESATTVLERIYRSFASNPVPFFENICLLNLVDIEVTCLEHESMDIQADCSGPWMRTLEDYVTKQNLPGIAAQSKILKAKLRKRQGRQKELEHLIKEVLKSAESPSMRYLKNLVSKEFPEFVLA
ncbi:MAG: tetratricopeptide repeat protein [Candidatus Thorarchaeota archaeon]